jgi:flagellar basal body L-ring protein FlgH
MKNTGWTLVSGIALLSAAFVLAGCKQESAPAPAEAPTVEAPAVEPPQAEQPAAEHPKTTEHPSSEHPQ